jgi:hypothetical protein
MSKERDTLLWIKGYLEAKKVKEISFYDVEKILKTIETCIEENPKEKSKELLLESTHQKFAPYYTNPHPSLPSDNKYDIQYSLYNKVSEK